MMIRRRDPFLSSPEAFEALQTSFGEPEGGSPDTPVLFAWSALWEQLQAEARTLPNLGSPKREPSHSRDAWPSPEDGTGRREADRPGDPGHVLAPAAPEGAEADTLLTPPPGDPRFAAQWHLTHAVAGIDLRDTWADYTGRGVRVAVVDDGFDVGHADLAASYLLGADYDWRMRDTDARAEAGDRHGTAVMGVVGADINGVGAVGVAHGAELAGLRIGYGNNGSAGQYANALRDGARFDVVNSSWGYSTPFQDNFQALAFMSSEAALVHGTTAGRGGLGTVYVFSAGNSRGSGDSVNYHHYGSNPYSIAVAAMDSAGRVAGFSNPGSALLVSAPGVGIVTTDLTGAAGYASGDTASVSGTSFSAPIVSGVAALMLDANDDLGWRDVQEILAYSSRMNDAGRQTWQFNDARDWNGGGLRTSTDYGFGLVDAHAAVRLAETWQEQSTTADLRTATAASAGFETRWMMSGSGLNLAVPNGQGSLSHSLFLGDDLLIDRVEVALDLRHTWRGDLRVTLVAPGGTESVLANRPGGAGSGADNIIFELGSTQFWGEQSRGNWTLRVEDLGANGETGFLAGWRLNVMGDARSPDNTYVYTDDFALAASRDPGRRGVLSDASGLDGVNASAVTTSVVLDLQSGLSIGGRSVSIAPGTVIERAFAGDANDAVRGNDAGNLLWGGRGNDALAGRGGADVFAFGPRSGRDVLEDFAGEDEVWLMDGVGVASLAGSVATLTDGATLTAANGWQWSAADFVSRSGWMA